jgi:hypothetical protein
MSGRLISVGDTVEMRNGVSYVCKRSFADRHLMEGQGHSVTWRESYIHDLMHHGAIIWHKPAEASRA